MNQTLFTDILNQYIYLCNKLVDEEETMLSICIDGEYKNDAFCPPIIRIDPIKNGNHSILRSLEGHNYDYDFEVTSDDIVEHEFIYNNIINLMSSKYSNGQNLEFIPISICLVDHTGKHIKEVSFQS